MALEEFVAQVKAGTVEAAAGGASKGGLYTTTRKLEPTDPPEDIVAEAINQGAVDPLEPGFSWEASVAEARRLLEAPAP